MDKIMLILLVIAIVMSFFVGNAMIIFAIYESDASYLAEDGWLLVLIAVVVDFILLCFVIAKIRTPVSSSFQLMRSGLKNRRKEKKEAAKLKKLLENEALYVNRLQELRDKGISESATKRTFRFCQLIETIAGREQLQACLSKVSEKKSVLDEIDDIESRMLKIAESCKNAGDADKCKYYLGLIKSNKLMPKVTSLENDCKEQLFLRKREKKAIWSWTKWFLGTLFLGLMIFAGLYIEDTPYRELRSMIKDQSLTAEMCDWKNRNSEDSFYDYFQSPKGYKLLASELTQLHRDNDVNKAMWLLCIQPDCIDGYHLCASSSFIKWIVEYAKNNGVRSTNQEGAGDSWYNVYYDVDGYRITIDSYEDKASNINDFSISDGENRNTIYARNKYQQGNMPTIE